MKVPPPNVSDFPVGALVHGQVKWLAEFGLFIEFRYHAAGCRWAIDGLLHFSRTANAERARALRYDDWVEAVVTAYDATKMKLAVALPADPRWRTPGVVGLAGEIRTALAFNRLPALADALEAAECADTAVLAHCRAESLGEDSWLIPLLVGHTSDAEPLSSSPNLR